jgi:hypothetical protein
MKTHRVLATLALSAMCSVLAVVNAAALPITGEVFFTGSGTLKLGAANSTAAFADGIDFNNPVAIQESISTGAYSGLQAATTASFVDLVGSYAFGVVGSVGAFSVSPFWTFTDGGINYSFRLTSVTTNAIVGSGATISRVVGGTGVASVTGGSSDYEDTFGEWQLSTSGRRSTISFSAYTVAVPDSGSAVALLGLALLGVDAARRRIRR